jgi:hypothetical protein
LPKVLREPQPSSRQNLQAWLELAGLSSSCYPRCFLKNDSMTAPCSARPALWP